MHYTLHLTSQCNMRCGYCYVSQSENRMSVETVHKAVDLALQSGNSRLGLVFFGGEPLLCQDLIQETIRYSTERIREDASAKFFYKITTNGLLLDDAFVQYA
ncbi:MAG: radical SAM protein, partial [Coriobacteriia bacterium]|nr:radical SAM protein [Coriobacteriia bacterium]